jgi:hypothetical protein
VSETEFLNIIPFFRTKWEGVTHTSGGGRVWSGQGIV